jgi:choline dehydrogenase-like flavoprotein
MAFELNPSQREVLAAICDTIVPAIDRAVDADGFWGRKATDIGVDAGIAELMATLAPEQAAGLAELIDALGMQGFASASQLSREQLLRNVSLMGALAAGGVQALVGMTLFLTYGAPDPTTGQNPNWRTFGYPGPISAPPAVDKTIVPVVPDGDELTLEVDVCIVGSGAGGGVIAGELSARGCKVVVLEAGGYFNESDFNQLELWAYQNMYYRGGPTPTADMNVTLQAGATLGGGTVVNWTNCLRTSPWVREQWAREHGLEGLDSADFDRHLDAVLHRISANADCSDFNGPHQRMRDGAQQLGWSFKTIVRNADPSSYTPETAAYMGFGDQSGSKQSATKTYLQDAFDAGAEIVVHCHADELLVEGGHAVGVRASYADPVSGRTAQVLVRAPHVVVACGALESPALLMRSRLGGPAVGDFLRLHPCTAVYGLYDEDQRAWWGPPQAGLVDQFAAAEDGYGFLIESAQYAPALVGSALPFTGPRAHKELLEQARYGATFIGLLRDHGHGRVTIDPNGEPIHLYSLEDELDVRNSHRAIDAQARLHEAAGAKEIFSLAAGLPAWRRGEDIGAFIASAHALPLRAGGQRLFSAHQMGTCRMGLDPQTSVAGPWGELHEAAGVWIGDASAFPTSSGTNPMITVMALAHRTAEAIAAAVGATEKSKLAPSPAGAA